MLRAVIGELHAGTGGQCRQRKVNKNAFHEHNREESELELIETAKTKKKNSISDNYRSYNLHVIPKG